MLASMRAVIISLFAVIMAAPLSAQIKKEQTQDNLFILSTPAWKMTFNGERGGELNKVELSDGDKLYRVNSTFAFKSLDTIPALSFASTRDSYYSGKWDVFYANEGRGCKFEVLRESPGEIHFRVSGRPRVMENGKVGPWVVTYTWHVYEVGVVFCDFEISLPTKDDTFELAWALMGLHVEDYAFKEKHQGKAAKFTWDYGLVDKTFDKGRWQPPILSAIEAQPLDVDFTREGQPDVLNQWIPYGGATFNLDHDPATSYTNAMEIVWEDAKPLIGASVADFGTHFKFRQSGLSPPPTWMGSDRNPPTFSFEWNLYHGATTEIAGPMTYRNRFGLGFTTQRTTGRPSAHPVLKNRVQAARIYTWVNAGKSGDAWYPGNDVIAKMSTEGANVLILGDSWRKGGAYEPASPDALKRVVSACHDKGIRVALTMRGEDYYTLERGAAWFTDYLKQDYDGLYVVHPSFLLSPANANAYPVKIAGEEVAALGDGKTHVDAYAHFLWERKLRALVGPNGFLVGETDPQAPTRIGMACFDAYAPAIGGLAGMVDGAVYARYRTGNGCAPRASNTRNDRGTRALAFSAAYGDSPQVMLGEHAGDPTDPADDANTAFKNLWKLYRLTDLESAEAYNTVSTAAKVFRVDSTNLCGTLYKISPDEMLLVFANIGPSTAAKVTLDFTKLGIKPGSFAGKVVRISAGEWAEGESVAVKDGSFQTGDLGRFDVAAFHLKRQ